MSLVEWRELRIRELVVSISMFKLGKVPCKVYYWKSIVRIFETATRNGDVYTYMAFWEYQNCSKKVYRFLVLYTYTYLCIFGVMCRDTDTDSQNNKSVCKQHFVLFPLLDCIFITWHVGVRTDWFVYTSDRILV